MFPFFSGNRHEPGRAPAGLKRGRVTGWRVPLHCRSVETRLPGEFLNAPSWIGKPDLHFGLNT